MITPEYQTQLGTWTKTELVLELEAVLIDFCTLDNKGEDCERVRLLKREIFRRMPS